MKTKGNVVIDILNEVLAAELLAINQYFIHSELCDSWGYERLHAAQRKSSIDEMKHAELLIERILELGGMPEVQGKARPRIGSKVMDQFANDATVERDAIQQLNAGIPTCREQGDATTAVLLEGILKSEEGHLAWIETQLGLIKRLGGEVYLAQQIHG